MPKALQIPEPQAVTRFITDLYAEDAESPPEGFKQQVLERLEAIIPCDSALWGRGSFENETPRIHSIFPYRQPAALLAVYEQIQEDDPFIAALIANPGRTVRDLDIMPQEPCVDIMY